MKTLSVALGLLGILTGCSADTSKDTATTESDNTSGSVSAVADVSELKLSSLVIDLPAALEGNASSLRLAGGKRSVEACQMGQTVKEVTRRVSSVANFACHIEVEKDKIAFGTKTKITFQGQEFGRLWVQKDGDKISFAMCQDSSDNKNKQLIEITKVTEFGPAGQLFEKGSNTNDGQEQAWTSSMSFDFTAEGISSMEAKDNFSAGGNNEFLREVSLLLKEAGVSSVALASKGSWNDQEFAQRGAGKFNGSYGNALFQNSGSVEFQGSSQTFSFANRSYFDDKGIVVESSASSDFAGPSGALYISKSDVPAYVTSASSITAPSGWVAEGCPDVDVTVELNPESAEHQACESDRDDEQTDCWSEANFEQGTATSDLD